jgi:hypothetical protein
MVASPNIRRREFNSFTRVARDSCPSPAWREKVARYERLKPEGAAVRGKKPDEGGIMATQIKTMCLAA